MEQRVKIVANIKEILSHSERIWANVSTGSAHSRLDQLNPIALIFFGVLDNFTVHDTMYVRFSKKFILLALQRSQQKWHRASKQNPYRIANFHWRWANANVTF